MTKNSAHKSIHGVNPQTGEILPEAYPVADEKSLNATCLAAANAAPACAVLLPREKAALLRAIADNIMALGDDLIALTGKETGLPEARLVGERGRTVNQLRMFADLVEEGSWVDARIDLADPDREPLPKPDVRSMLRPIGPVAVFGASNFPLAFSAGGGDTASALAAGNPVVVKAHPAHPGTSALVAGAIERAVASTSLPAGAFGLLQSGEPDLAVALVRHSAIKAVGFTGSLRAGRALFDAAAGRPDPIPVYAEMGSINPVVVLSDALATRADSIAQGLSQSMTMGVGQFCTQPGVVMVEGDAAAFTDALVEALKPMDAGTMLTVGLNENYQRGLDRLQATNGVEPALRKDADPGPGGSQAAAAVLTCDQDTFLEHPELSDEVFGPATLVVSCRDRDSIVRVVNELPGQLTATVHGTDAELTSASPLLEVMGQIAGRLIINGFPTGVEVCNAMHHGGPYPATTEVRSTSVGTAAISRYARPLCYQNFSDALLPQELQNANPLGIWRLVDGKRSREPIA
jgi:alpha-ketoglutaric semialdehyde dehydrogenase